MNLKEIGFEILEKNDKCNENRKTYIRKYQWHRFLIETTYRLNTMISDKPDILIKCQCIDIGPNIEWFYEDFVIVKNPLITIVHSKDIDEYIKNTIDAKELISLMQNHMNDLLGEQI